MSCPRLNLQSYSTDSAGSRDRRHRITLDLRTADKPPQPDPDDKHKNDQPATLNRRNLRQGRGAGPAGMVASLRESGSLSEGIPSVDSDHTSKPLGGNVQISQNEIR